MNNCQAEVCVLVESHLRAYSRKVRLLHLPDCFGRKIPLKLVDEQLPGRSISTRGVSPQGDISEKFVYFIYPKRFGRQLPLKLVDDQLPGR